MKPRGRSVGPFELQPGAAIQHARLAIIEIERGNAQAAVAAAQQEPPGAWQDIIGPQPMRR